MRRADYVSRQVGDVVAAADWSRLQVLIREEVRRHAHEGAPGDTDRLASLGALLDNPSLEEGCVDARAFAPGAVTAGSLQPRAVSDPFVAADAALPESLLSFDAVAGHDHDGRTSSALAAESVGAPQLADEAVVAAKLAPDLLGALEELEATLSIPQALTVVPSTAPGGSLVSIVGHGFGWTQTADSEVRLWVLEGGRYRPADEQPLVEVWGMNWLDVRLPADPTGLLQVVVGGLALPPLPFTEALAVSGSSPAGATTDAPVDGGIRILFSDRLAASTDGTLRVLLAGALQDLIPEAPAEGEAPVLGRAPIEVFGGDGARLDGLLRLEADGRTVTFRPLPALLPHDTPVLVRVYGLDAPATAPLLIGRESSSSLADTVEISFTTQLAPPDPPLSVRVIGRPGASGAGSPPDLVNLTNHRAVPLLIETPPSALPSDAVLVELSDGQRELSLSVPTRGGGEELGVTVDASGLADGLLRIRAQMRNLTTGSPWVLAQGPDRRTGEVLDRVLKDTQVPFLRVLPLQSPTNAPLLALEIEVEAGSEVRVEGGRRWARAVDEDYRGELTVAVPLKRNSRNWLRVWAVDPAGNPSAVVTHDANGRRLVVVHDDTVPTLSLSERVRTPRRERSLVLAGRVNERATVVAAGMGMVHSQSTDAAGSFRLELPLRPNQRNDLRVVATDPAGNTSAPILVRVVHDDLPPPIRLSGAGGNSTVTGAAGPTPVIRVRNRPYVTLLGTTQPGAQVILTGQGHRVTTTARATGAFAVSLPFRLVPTDLHRRSEDRSWVFDLDAVDRAGNRSHQAKRVTVVLEYRIPHSVRRHTWGWWWGWRWWGWWVDGYWFFWDARAQRAGYYTQYGRIIPVFSWY